MESHDPIVEEVKDLEKKLDSVSGGSSELRHLRNEIASKLILESTYAGKKVEIYTSKAVDVKDRLE